MKTLRRISGVRLPQCNHVYQGSFDAPMFYVRARQFLCFCESRLRSMHIHSLDGTPKRLTKIAMRILTGFISRNYNVHQMVQCSKFEISRLYDIATSAPPTRNCRTS